MAFMIAEDCINCGACEPVCPNHGIRNDVRRSIYVIDSDACTECVGVFKYQQCVAICPVDCCVIDPRHIRPEVAAEIDGVLAHGRAAAPKWWERLFGLVRNDAPAQNVTQRDSSPSTTLSSASETLSPQF